MSPASFLRQSRSAVALLCGITLGSVASAETVVTAPPFAKAPKIDGRIGEAEWRMAAKVSGMEWRGVFDPRSCSVWIGYDTDKVYVAVRSELPPGGHLVSAVTEPSGRMIRDDGVELWFHPPERRPEGDRQFGFFQLMVNPKGVVYDRHYDPGYGLPAKAWQPKFEQGHGKIDGNWEAEFAVPFSEIGVPVVQLPRVLRLLVARNFQQPFAQRTITSIAGFTAKEHYATLRMQPTGPVVQCDFSRDTKQPPVTLTVLNTSKAALLVEVTLSPAAGKANSGSQKVMLRAGERRQLEFGAGFRAEEMTALKAVVTDADGNVVYRREAAFEPRPKRVWTNPEAYLRFRQTSDGAKNLRADTAVGDSTAPPRRQGQVRSVDGRKGRGKAVAFGEKSYLVYDRSNLSVPMAVSCWVKPLKAMPKMQRQVQLADGRRVHRRPGRSAPVAGIVAHTGDGETDRDAPGREGQGPAGLCAPDQRQHSADAGVRQHLAGYGVALRQHRFSGTVLG